MADENKKAIIKSDLDSYVTENKILTKSQFISGEYLPIIKIRNQASEVIAGDVAVYDPFIDDIRYVVLNTATGGTMEVTCDYYCIPLGVVIYPFAILDSDGNPMMSYDFCSILSIKNGSGILPENGTKQLDYTLFGSITYASGPSFLKKTNIKAAVFQSSTELYATPANLEDTDVIFPIEVNTGYTGNTFLCPRDSNACYRVNTATADTTQRLVISPYDYAYQGAYDDSNVYINANIDMTEQYSQYPEWLDENLPDEYRNWRDVSTIPYFNSVVKVNGQPGSPGAPSIVGACRFMPITINGQKIVWGMPTLFHALAVNVRIDTIKKTFKSLNSPFLPTVQYVVLGEFYDKTGNSNTYYKTLPLSASYYMISALAVHKYAACIPFSFK